jgi:hypothetical protein
VTPSPALTSVKIPRNLSSLEGFTGLRFLSKKNLSRKLGSGGSALSNLETESAN